MASQKSFKRTKPKKPKKSVGSVEKATASVPAPAAPPTDRRTRSLCGNSLNFNNFKGTFGCGVCKKKRMGECCYTGHPCKT